MRVLVCGGRDFASHTYAAAVLDMLHADYRFTTVIHGGASGADSIAGWWARERAGVPEEKFVADWKIHGKKAGPIRNERMLREAKPDLVVAFPGGRGTAHMVRIAQKAGVRVFEIPGPPSPKPGEEKP